MILRVLEHQKIYIKKLRDLAKVQISQADAEILRIIDQKNGFIFKWGNDYVMPQQWVGVITFKDFSIEILPKISDIKDAVQSSEILCKMLSVAYDVPMKNGVNASVKLISNGLVDVLITNYVELIKKYIQSGPVLEYKKYIKNLKSVKGNILFSEQINRNSVNLTKFICKYSKMDIDNKYNKVIKLTLIKMKSLSNSNINIKSINNVLSAFENVQTDYNIDWKNLQADKAHYKLQDIINISQLFLDNYSVSLSAGNYTIISLLFDMNKIFEKYIYMKLKRIYKQNLHYQYSKEFLLENIQTGRLGVKLKPDMYLKMPESDIVIDTKWKKTGTNIKESDAYQMNAYMSVLNNTKKSIVIYPQNSYSAKINNLYKIRDLQKEKFISVKTVDLKLLLDKNDCRLVERLKSLVSE